jgi:hypothetical protein
LPQPTGEDQLRQVIELGSATAAALVAAYVRAKGDPRPLSLPSILARVAESIVCGFLATGAAALMEWTDPRSTVGLAAALGLLGTATISDLILRAAGKRADRA